MCLFVLNVGVDQINNKTCTCNLPIVVMLLDGVVVNETAPFETAPFASICTAYSTTLIKKKKNFQKNNMKEMDEFIKTNFILKMYSKKKKKKLEINKSYQTILK